MNLPRIAISGLETACNRYLALDPEALEQLAELQGKVIRVEISGLALKLYFLPRSAGVAILTHSDIPPDCVLRGTVLGLAQMRSATASSEQLFAGAVAIEGNTELAHRFGNILANLDIDWEEQLSHLTGDVVAHSFGNRIRALTSWGAQTRRRFGLDVREYLQEEIALLPTRFEIEDYLDEVDRLRDDTDRLQSRCNRLLRKMSAGRRREDETEA